MGATERQGKIYSHIAYHRAWHPAYQDKVPYNVSLVDLDEGGRLVSNVVGCPPEEVKIGMKVEVIFEDSAGLYAAEVSAGEMSRVDCRKKFGTHRQPQHDRKIHKASKPSVRPEHCRRIPRETFSILNAGSAGLVPSEVYPGVSNGSG